MVGTRKTKKTTEKTGRGRPYHHGDLRKALLAAAEVELAEKGVEGFTLRGCAKRAGVSHAAPAYHFKDANALLTALAAEGYGRFTAAMQARQAQEEDDARKQLVAAGLGYIDFATANPALFRLMFFSDRPDASDPLLRSMARQSFELLVAAVTRTTRGDPPSDEDLACDIAAAWSMVHGIANLLLAARLPLPADLPPTERERLLRAMIARVVPR